MGTPSQEQVVRLLGELRQGNRAALDELLPLVYGELRALAGNALQASPPGHTLQPTALLHEAYLRLMGRERPDYESFDHFMAVATKAMRSVLVDHARRRGAQKRGGASRRVDLTDNVAGYEERGLDLVALDGAIDALAKLDPELERVVELLFFGGLTAAEAAEVLHCSSRTVERNWRTARAWLRAALDSDASPN
jgi:RNA polymerase sigma factor (TIGR02999 family)